MSTPTLEELAASVAALTKRVDELEETLRKDHETLERDHKLLERDHELLERLDSDVHGSDDTPSPVGL